MMEQLSTVLAGRNGIVVVAALAVLALLFLALWLLARRGGGKAAGADLRRVGNELKVARGDLVQARHDHATKITKLGRELENLRAVAAGKMPPELEEWRRRAEAAETRLASERATLEVQYQERMAAAATESFDQTMIAPNISTMHERMAELERELAEARDRLSAAETRLATELKAQFDKLSAEKAAALTALAQRLKMKPPTAETIAELTPITEGDGHLRYPYLEIVAGGAVGERHYLPYEQSTLGREASCTIALNEARASRLHAEISFDGSTFTVRDLNSRNGTYLNDQSVDSAPLQFGDVIAIGDLRLVFECAGHATVDDVTAHSAYEAMLATAPKFAAAKQGLAEAKSRRNIW